MLLESHLLYFGRCVASGFVSHNIRTRSSLEVEIFVIYSAREDAWPIVRWRPDLTVSRIDFFFLVTSNDA